MDNLPIEPMEPKPDTNEAWKRFDTLLLNMIQNGYLDKMLKKVAEACVERNKVIRKGEASPEREGVVPPSVQGEVLLICSELGCRFSTYDNEIMVHHHDNGHQKSDEPLRREQQVAPPPKVMLRRAKGKRSSRGASSTFRWTDGHLYDRDLVYKKMVNYDANLRVRIDGVGQKACKVTFFWNSDVQVVDPRHVPAQYRNYDGSIKDPLFMGLSILAPLLKNATPIPE